MFAFRGFQSFFFATLCSTELMRSLVVVAAVSVVNFLED